MPRSHRNAVKRSDVKEFGAQQESECRWGSARRTSSGSPASSSSWPDTRRRITACGQEPGGGGGNLSRGSDFRERSREGGQEFARTRFNSCAQVRGHPVCVRGGQPVSGRVVRTALTYGDLECVKEEKWAINEQERERGRGRGGERERGREGERERERER
jgi:hypothetical protein